MLSVAGLTNSELSGSAGITDANLATIATANKVSGSAIQVAATSAIEDSTGLRLKSAVAGTGLTLASQVLGVGGLTNSELSGSAGITDANLAQITGTDKVAGSAVELSAQSAIENSSGLRLKAGTAGTGISMSTAQVLSLTNDSVSITAGAGLGGGGSASLGGSAVSVNIASAGVVEGMIAGNAVTAPKLGVTFAQKIFASHSATKCNLDAEIATANQCKSVLVFRNGIALENTTATGGTNNSIDTFAVTQTDSGNSDNSSVNLGAAPDNDLIMVWYFS